MSKRVIVYHDAYRCDTGCCGHAVEVGNRRRFALTDHPEDGETDREFAERMVTEKFGAKHVADLDWDNCIIQRDEW